MKRAANLVAIVTLAAALIWVYRVLFPSDERLIRRELANLVASANDMAIDEGVARFAAAASVGQHFTPDVIVDLGTPYGQLNGRDRLIAWAAAARGTEWRVGIADVRVTVDDAQSARVRMLATVTTATPDGDAEIETREVALGLRRLDRRWVISNVEVFLRDGSGRLTLGLPLRLREQSQRVAFGRAR